MVKNGVVTNDVRSFTVNQQKLKKSISKPSKAMYPMCLFPQKHSIIDVVTQRVDT